MKTTRFLLAASIIMLALTLTLSCSPIEEAAEDTTKESEGEQPSPSSAIVEEDEKEPIPSSSSSIIYPEITGIYLGCGYDVINSSYINRKDVKLTNPVLNINKMHYDGMIRTDDTTSEQKFDIFAGTSLKEFYANRNASMSVSYGAVLFSGKASVEFKTSTSSTTSISYIRGRSYRYTRDDYINGASPAKLSNYFKEDFINDLETEDAAQIIDRYGTHVLVRYYKGGSLEFNYTYKGSKLETSEELRVAVSASYFTFSGKIGYESETEKKELEENSEFSYYTYGGAGLSSFEMSELKEEYGTWINSIDNKADITGIGNFSESFVPLWDLVRAGGYLDKADELESEFENRANAQAAMFAKEEAKAKGKENKETAKQEQKDEKAKDKAAENK